MRSSSLIGSRVVGNAGVGVGEGVGVGDGDGDGVAVVEDDDDVDDVVVGEDTTDVGTISLDFTLLLLPPPPQAVNELTSATHTASDT